MRTVFDTIGLIIVGMGVFGLLGGLVIAQVNRGGTSLAITGVVAIFIGWLISRAAGKKTCPQCAESIKAAAHKCKHCGSVFA